MAKYKVWLTVKDSYGNTKELDGGNIDINLDEEDVENIVDNLKDNINLSVKWGGLYKWILMLIQWEMKMQFR